MKKYLLTTALALSVDATVFAAAPVTTIDAGSAKASVDANFLTHMTGASGNHSGYGAALEVGLTDRLGAQYDFNKYNVDGPDLKVHQVGAVYELNDTFNAYGALTYVRSGDSATGYQVGVIGHRPLADKVQGFAKVGLGDDIKHSFQAGATYAYSDNIDFNLYYQYDKFDYKNRSGSVKGLHAGVGYKF